MKKLNHRSYILLLVIVMVLATILLSKGTFSTSVQSVQAISDRETQAVELPSCRFGIATNTEEQVDWVDDVKAGWYMSFGSSRPAASNGAEFVPLVWVQQDNPPGDDYTYLDTYTISPPLTKNGLGRLIDERPGALWMVGNEVDRGPAQGSSPQGDMQPQKYAEAYHQIYHYIKDRDPSALVGNAGMVQASPGRLQYLSIVWDTYLTLYGEPWPVDVWNTHLYIMPEIRINGQPSAMASIAVGTDPALAKLETYDPDGNGPLQPKDVCPLDSVYCYAEHDNMTIFANQIKEMRKWMKDHGQRNKPLLLTEFSQLYPYFNDGGTCFLQDEFGNCFTPSRVISFLNSSFNYLLTATDPLLGYPLDNNRLVQQSLWFSVNNYPTTGFVSDLVVKDGNGTLSGLSSIGSAFRSKVNSVPTSVNLLHFPPPQKQTWVVDESGTADVILWASIGNNGDIPSDQPFSVTFYANAALTIPIGTVTVPVPGSDDPAYPVPGCGRRAISVSTVWSDRAPGDYQFWMKIDSGGVIPESNEGDNVTSGLFTVLDSAHQLNLPIIRR